MAPHSRHQSDGGSGRRRQRLAVLVAAAAVLGGAAVAAAPSASAGVLPTKTTVTASPVHSAQGDAVTLVASVKMLNLPGLGVVPTGTVVFKDGVTLGSAPLGSCLLVTCKASFTTASLPIGSTTVTATYAGDLVAAGSAGSVAITVAALADSDTVVCPANQFCETEEVSTPDGQIEAFADGDPSAHDYTLSVNLSAGQLTCPGYADPPSNWIATFNSTASDAGKELDWAGFGDQALAMQAAFDAHPDYVGCYASPNPFVGYNIPSHSIGQAPFIASDGLYEAAVPACFFTESSDFAKPCFTYDNYEGGAMYYIYAPVGDPKFSGP
jgi:Bacterial Ig-like domain (group 3)